MNKILTSSIKFANTGKIERLELFLLEYQRAVQYYLDYIWNMKTSKFDISNQRFVLPKFMKTTEILFDSTLSARAKSAALTQAIGKVKSRIEKLHRTQYIVRKHQRDNKPNPKLQSKYDKLINKLAKPSLGLIHPELASTCIRYELSENIQFDGVIQLVSLGKSFGK